MMVSGSFRDDRLVRRLASGMAARGEAMQEEDALIAVECLAASGIRDEKLVMALLLPVWERASAEGIVSLLVHLGNLGVVPGQLLHSGLQFLADNVSLLTFSQLSLALVACNNLGQIERCDLQPLVERMLDELLRRQHRQHSSSSLWPQEAIDLIAVLSHVIEALPGRPVSLKAETLHTRMMASTSS